jgi:hypothetical protein
MPCEDRKPAEAREISDHILAQGRWQADQGLVLGEVTEGQDRNEGLAVEGCIAATQHPGSIEGLQGRAATGLAHSAPKLLDLCPRPDLEISRQLGAKLTVAPSRKGTFALAHVQPHQSGVHTFAVRVDLEIPLGTVLGLCHLAAPEPEREELPEGRSRHLAQALPLWQEPVLVFRTEVRRIRQQIAGVQLAGCRERLEGSFLRERLEAFNINGDTVRVQPD